MIRSAQTPSSVPRSHAFFAPESQLCCWVRPRRARPGGEPGLGDAGYELETRGWKVPFSQIAPVSDDPIEPSPALTLGGRTFAKLPEGLLDTLALHAADADSPFVEIELRHIATAPTPRYANCYPHRDAGYVLDVVAGATTGEEVRHVRERVTRSTRPPHVTQPEGFSIWPNRQTRQLRSQCRYSTVSRRSKRASIPMAS